MTARTPHTRLRPAWLRRPARRSPVATALLLGAVIGAGIAAPAATYVTTVGTSTAGATRPYPVKAAVQFAPRGFGATCSGDACTSGGHSFAVHTPGTHNRYHAVMTVTFQYTTTGAARYQLAAVKLTDEVEKYDRHMYPRGYPLPAATTQPLTQTVQFTTRGLRAGADYQYELQALVERLDPAGDASFRARDVVTSIEFIPAG